jgi:hypothetical protein
MKHAVRMLLIPENVYQSLMLQQQQNPLLPQSSGTALGETAVEHVRAKIEKIPRATLLNEDERLLHYGQEFKRYKKLQEDEQSRSTNVRLQNVVELGEAAAEAMAKKSKAKSPPILKMKVEKNASMSKKVKKSEPTDSEGSNYTSAEDGEKEEENLADAQIGLELDENLRMKLKDEALNYAVKNPNRLGLNEDMQVIRLMHKKFQPIRDSSAIDIIEYHFKSNEEKSAIKKPAGYKSFMDMCKGDVYMAARLFPRSVKTHKKQKGEGFASTKINAFKGSAFKNPSSSQKYIGSVSVFRFKPQLW